MVYWIGFHSGTTSSRFHIEYLYCLHGILDRVSFWYHFIPVPYRVSVLFTWYTGSGFILVPLHPGSILSICIVYMVYRIGFHSGITSSQFHTEYLYCLHDTGSSFILVPLHPGSILSICIVYMVYWIGFHSGTTSSRFHTEYLYCLHGIPDRVSFWYHFILVLY